jgi:Rieske Fe-S protein
MQQLTLLVTGLVGLLAVSALAIPFIAYLIGPIRKRAPDWVPLGPITKFPLGETRLATFDNPLGEPWDGVTAHNSVYVRFIGKGRDGKPQFLVFAVNCAHLGCPVEWFPQSGLFMCPCHGGVYYENGERASGPPPRGLYKCAWKVEEDTLKIQAPHYPTLQNELT